LGRCDSYQACGGAIEATAGDRIALARRASKVSVWMECAFATAGATQRVV
jgi:hypothetical protein